MVIIALLQAGFLAEQNKFNQGAFIFGYIICLFILFTFSMAEFISWLGKEKKYSVHPLLVILSGIIALVHLGSGILYFNLLVKGQIYF